MRLSERIEQADYDCETLWRYLEEAGHPADGDAINTLKAVMQTLLDCEKLAKRYEDAPVGDCVACDFEGYERPTWHVIDDRDAVPLTLRGRVRIVLDKEG